MAPVCHLITLNKNTCPKTITTFIKNLCKLKSGQIPGSQKKKKKKKNITYSLDFRRLQRVRHLLVIFCAPADVATIPATKQDIQDIR